MQVRLRELNLEKRNEQQNFRLPQQAMHANAMMKTHPSNKLKTTEPVKNLVSVFNLYELIIDIDNY